MKKALLTIALALVVALATSCASLSTLPRKAQAVVEYVALSAPTSPEQAIDGHRTLRVGPYQYKVAYQGLWLDGDTLRAESFSAAGMFGRYEGAPFAWRVEL